MEIKYTVQSCTEDEVSVTATVAGREVVAKIPGLVVECVSECNGMGHTFRFTPDDMDAAKEEFAVGNAIKITFSSAE